MKKIMSLMLGLGLVLGVASVSFAQDTTATTKKEKKVKKSKKKADKTDTAAPAK